jgi:hypothetical protein
VAAELEEAGLDADPVAPQQLRPEARQDLFDRSPWGDVGILRNGGFGRRQPVAVDLAADGQRQGLKGQE